MAQGMKLNNIRQRAKWVLRLTLVAAMVLCLACTAQYSLSFIATSPAPVGNSCRIQVRQLETDRLPVAKPVCRLDDLVVDGRLMRPESIERSSQWTVVEKQPRRRPTRIQFNDGPQECGTLNFSGAAWLLIAQVRAWNGVFEVQRGNRNTQSIAVQAPEPWKQVRVIEDPPAPLSGRVLIAAFSIFALVVWMIAPWRDDRRVALWLAFFLVAFHAMFWATQCVATTNDSRAYRTSLASILHGLPAYYPPGYPAFLGFIEAISGEENLGRWVALVQHGLAAVAAFWVYSLAKRLAPVELALVGGILAGTLSPISAMSQTVMSEIPTIFAMVGALYFGLRAAETGRYRFAALAGALTGWGGLLRVVPLAALLPAIGQLLLCSSTHRKFRLATVTLCFAAGIVLLPVGWFTYKTGKPELANSTGKHLYNRVVYEQRQLDESGPATQNLLTILDGEDPRQFDWYKVLDRPGFQKLPPEEREKRKTTELLLRVSWEGIRKDPLAYLSYTPGLAWRELVADAGDGPKWGTTNALNAGMESPPPLRLTASGLRWRSWFHSAYRIVWPLLCWASVLGVLLGLSLPQRGLVLALAVVLACYILATASLEFFLGRYNVPTIPFVTILSILPFRVLLCGWTATGQTPVPEPTVVATNGDDRQAEPAS
jgi:4-amino-4-deoxy-L-arabinose transferase-like glycosyltransferase